MGDQEMVDYLAHALQEPASPRPSIETLLHGFLSAEAVIHTHADAIVSLTNNDRAAETLREVYGADVVALPYRRPGFLISREVAQTFERHPKARALLLEKHGTICWGATVKEAYLSTIELISRAEEAIEHRAKGRTRFGGAAVTAAAPRRDGASRSPWRPRCAGSSAGTAAWSWPSTMRPTCSSSPARGRRRRSRRSAPRRQITPSTPSGCPASPAWTIRGIPLPSSPASRHPSSASSPTTPATSIPTTRAARRWLTRFPRVITVAGLGMFTAGKDRRTAGIVNDIYRHTISVLGAATSFGAYVSLSAKDAFDIEYWPLELYKLSQAPPEKELARRIALVTGGASGIGRAAALRLAADGAHVIVADLDAAGARKVADEVVAGLGAGRAIGVGMDVSSEASVTAGFEEAVLAYGGLDIVVSNAGIAHSSPVDRMSLADWERSFAVNSTGHFLVAREGMRVLQAQGLGGAFVFVATKNVMSPGKDFAAYSAAKAAEAQLAKVLALEGGPHGIRSNIVNPDAVFRDSKLWSDDVRRERARAQGIAVGRARGLLPQAQHPGRAHPAGGRGGGRALPRLRPLGQDHGLHHHGGRRRQGRLPAVSDAAHSLRRVPDDAPARGAARHRAARGRARLRLDLDGRPRLLPHPLYESLTLLASYIGITSRVKLGAGVYLLALRQPAIAAKITSTLDALSGGRLIFGVGVGGENPKEFEACGIPAQRARRARHRRHRRRAHALARLAGQLQGALHAVRGREHRPQARPEARAAHLDRRPLGRGARARGAAGRRLDLLRRPARALQAERRQDRGGCGDGGPAARGLHEGAPDLHHGGQGLRERRARLGRAAVEALRAGLRAAREEVRRHRHARPVRGAARALHRGGLLLLRPETRPATPPTRPSRSRRTPPSSSRSSGAA